MTDTNGFECFSIRWAPAWAREMFAIIMQKLSVPPANVVALQQSIADLQVLVPRQQQVGRHEKMTSSLPSDAVWISQSDLDNFASEISGAVNVLGPYLQQLVAGQTVQLAEADESQVKQAVQSLLNLEPPSPAPTPSGPTGPTGASGPTGATGSQ